jgi:hypothetical protein
MSGNYYRNEAVEVMEMDGETVILNQDTFAVTKLNGTGGWVWETLAKRQSFDQLAERMSVNFDADRQTIGGDLAKFLKQMGDIGLIRLAE